MPTLAADSRLVDCVASLRSQRFRRFEVVIVDNSGAQRVRCSQAFAMTDAVLEPDSNVGYGSAVNLAAACSDAAYIAVINDDAVACPEWLGALVTAMESNPRAGMVASAVRLAGDGRVDSAGMLLGGDGTSKQRGHLQPASAFARSEEVLFPSGSAALYRRTMLDEIDGFDDSFFLYCEDADLGLRARWRGWRCLYAPRAVVHHHYSHSAGGASPLKAYYVERNRLFLLVKNFPAPLLWRAPLYTAARYFWHFALMFAGRGRAAEFRKNGHGAARLFFYVLRAHCALLLAMPRLWRERRKIRKSARIGSDEFVRLVGAHAIGPRQVAAL